MGWLHCRAKGLANDFHLASVKHNNLSHKPIRSICTPILCVNTHTHAHTHTHSHTHSHTHTHTHARTHARTHTHTHAHTRTHTHTHSSLWRLSMWSRASPGQSHTCSSTYSPFPQTSTSWVQRERSSEQPRRGGTCLRGGLSVQTGRTDKEEMSTWAARWAVQLCQELGCIPWGVCVCARDNIGTASIW